MVCKTWFNTSAKNVNPYQSGLTKLVCMGQCFYTSSNFSIRQIISLPQDLSPYSQTILRNGLSLILQVPILLHCVPMKLACTNNFG